MSSKGSYLTFFLGDFYFGIIATDVVELNKNLNVTIVPKSPKVIKGITNLRGQIVPVVDMHERLSLVHEEKIKETISIVLRCNGVVIALLVDRVGEIIELEGDTFEPQSTHLYWGCTSAPINFYSFLITRKLLME